MGQPLTGNEVQATYEGLLKTSSNATLATASLEPVSDGAGNDSALELAQTQARLKGEYVELANSTQSSGIVIDDAVGDKVNYYGNHDFSGATVTGLPTASGGLQNGTGAYSLKNADSLVQTPSTAAGAKSITLGDGNSNYAEKAIIIGSSNDNADSARVNSILIGNSVKGAQYSIVIGNNAPNYAAADAIQLGNSHVRTTGNYCINVGYGNDVAASGNVEQIVIGKSNTSNAQRNIIIGSNNTGSQDGTIIIGEGNSTTGGRNHGIGYQTVTTGSGEDKMAYGTLASATADRAIAIGRQASATHTNSVVLGTNVTSKADSTTHVAGLNVGTVDEYADNAAAVTAGLPIGQVYRTGDLLKVVHA